MTASLKISERPILTAFDGSEKIPVGKDNKAITISQLIATNLNFVNVKTFGAVGDGVTDDTLAIQAAIDYASAIHARVSFPDKQYLISVAMGRIITDSMSASGIGLLFKSDVIYDLGNSEIIVQANGFDRTQAISLLRVKNIKIFGGIISGDRSSHTGEADGGNHSLIDITEGNNIVVDGLIAKDSNGDGISIGIISKYVDGCSITEGSSIITVPVTGQNTYRKSLLQANDPIYSNVYFPEGTVVVSFDSTTITLSNSALTSSTNLSFAFYPQKSQNIRIENCTCDNNRRNGMTIESGRGIWVSDSYFINTNGVSPEAGVDIEPYYGNSFLREVYFDNCYLNGNAMADLYGQSTEHLRIKNCDFNGSVMFRGSQDVEISGCSLKSLTLKYAALNAFNNKFSNKGIAIYNEDYYTYQKPIDVDIQNNEFVFDENWDTNDPLICLFNLNNNPNMYNGLIFKNNKIKLKSNASPLNRTLIRTDERSPELFDHYEIVDNSFEINAASVTANEVLVLIKQNLADTIIKHNLIKLNISNSINVGVSLIKMLSNNYSNIKDNEIQIIDQSPDNIFTIENNTGTAIFDISKNEIVQLGGDTATLINSPETNGIPTIRTWNNRVNGIEV